MSTRGDRVEFIFSLKICLIIGLTISCRSKSPVFVNRPVENNRTTTSSEKPDLITPVLDDGSMVKPLPSEKNKETTTPIEPQKYFS